MPGGLEALLDVAEEAQVFRGRLRAILIPPGGEAFTEPEQTLEEIGARFQVTRERVRQMEAQALRRLSRALAPTSP